MNLNRKQKKKKKKKVYIYIYIYLLILAGTKELEMRIEHNNKKNSEIGNSKSSHSFTRSYYYDDQGDDCCPTPYSTNSYESMCRCHGSLSHNILGPWIVFNFNSYDANYHIRNRKQKTHNK